MSKIAYLILCHKNAEAVGDWIDAHLATKSYVAVHFDKRGSDEDFIKLTARFAGNKDVVFVSRRRCGWGEWSLVDATLEMLREALSSFKRATHFFLVSGDCVPIKPAKYIQAALDERSMDYIEVQDFNTSGWIQTGMVEDRYRYRHYFNERESRSLFYRSLGLQRLLGLSRNPPKGMTMKIGSQWWCLRRKTAETIVDFLNRRRDVVRFFKTVWIPDECFFQSIVWHLIPASELSNHPPTFLTFSDYGMPVVYHTDHLDYLKQQPRFFARKASEHQPELRESFSQLYLSDQGKIKLSDKGKVIYDFTVNSGRGGTRFAPLAARSSGSVGRDKQIDIVVCKDWWMGKMIAEASAKAGKHMPLGYVFQEEDAGFPDMGGYERGLGKRQIHRRSFINMVNQLTGMNHLTFCVDPAFIGVLKDFETDQCKTRFLYVGLDWSDVFCAGHAYRLGLLDQDDPKADPVIVQTMRHNLMDEEKKLLDEDLSQFSRIDPNRTMAQNSATLRSFSGMSAKSASALLTRLNYTIKGKAHVI